MEIWHAELPGHPGFIIDLDEVERHPNRPIDMGTIDAAAGRRSLELYAILQSFVRRRPAMIRAVTHNNGYEGWRILVTEMQPSTRQRQLALANQLANVKFDPKVSLAEQFVKYEEVVREYERVSGSKYNEDLKISTLVQACPSPLQVQIHMSLSSETTYQKLKEQVTRTNAQPLGGSPMPRAWPFQPQSPWIVLNPWRSTRSPPKATSKGRTRRASLKARQLRASSTRARASATLASKAARELLSVLLVASLVITLVTAEAAKARANPSM